MRKKTTTTDVANHVGLSRATVSYVLNGKNNSRIPASTRDLVLKAAEDLKWRRNRVAEAMPMGRIFTVGVIIGEKGVIHSQYVKNLYVDIMLAAQAQSLRTTLILGTMDSGVQIDDLGDGRLDGIIAVGNFCTPQWVAAIEAIGLPYVVIESEVGKNRITPPDAAGGNVAAHFLYGLGHRRIAHLPGPEERISAQRRRHGFLQAVADLELNPRHCAADFCEVSGAGIRAAIIALLTRPSDERPTAIFAFSDAYALHCMDAIKELGLRVPGDVSLIGYDNEITATVMRPRLTTVQNPVAEIAGAAVALLQSLCDGDEVAENSAFVFPVNVVARESTAPPPNL